MKRAEFKSLVKLAASEAVLPAYLSEEMDVFSGCAADTKRRYVTRQQVAALIRGECCTFGGSLDAEALTELERVAKRFDLID